MQPGTTRKRAVRLRPPRSIKNHGDEERAAAVHTGTDSVSQQTNDNYTELSFRGRTHLVPAVQIDGRTVVLTGRLLRIATVRSAEYVAGGSELDPEEVRRGFARIGCTVDIFTFTQNVGD